MVLLKNEDMEKLYAAKDILDNDFKRHYTTEQLAQKVGMNDFKLKYGFRHLFKISPYKYLTFVRIEKAKQVLECTDYPIKYVAIHVGIPDVPTFNKIFKRLTGVSPSEWRKVSKSKTA